MTKLDHVYYWVSDMDRAVRFYQETLGLSLADRQGDNWAVFDAGGRQFSLHRTVEGHPTAPGGATAVFSVEDLDRARVLLSERGVAFGHEGDVEGYARFASFQDPDGNAVQLIEYGDSGREAASNRSDGGMKGSH